MTLPDVSFGGPRIMRLQKILYGRKESPRFWYITVDSIILSKLDFTWCRFDTCMYIHESDGTMIVLYVDDLLLIIMADPVAEVQARITCRFDLVLLGPVNDFPGMVIVRDHTKQGLYRSQSGNIEWILEQVGLGKLNWLSMPLIPKGKYTPQAKDNPSIENSEPKADEQQYMQAVGRLGWLAGATRTHKL